MDSNRRSDGSATCDPIAHALGGRRLLVEGLGAAALYALLTIWLLQPLLSDPARSLFDGRSAATGHHGELALKDVLLLAWIYAWDWHALVDDPRRLYDSNAFHPYPSSLAFSEHALGKLPTAGVAFALTDNAVLAHQIDLVLSFALSAAALFVLLRSMHVSIVAGLLAGTVFAFSPVRLDTLHHSHLLGWQYLPLALLFLDRTVRFGRATTAACFAVLLLLQCLCSYYLAYMSLVGVGAFAIVFVLVARRSVSLRGTVLVVLGAAASLVAFRLLSSPYLELRAMGVLPRYDVDDAAGRLVLRHASIHPWRTYLDPWAELPYGSASPFVGWLPLGLALVGGLGATLTKDITRRAWIAASVAIAVAGWSLALGPSIELAGLTLPSPYELLSGLVPGFSSMRVPGRFALLMMLGLAILVGFGSDSILRRIAPQRFARVVKAAVGVAFFAVVAIEYRLPTRTFAAFPVDFARGGETVNAVLGRTGTGVVAEFPFHGSAGIEAATAMLNSTAHWHEIVNGKSGYEPRGRNVLRVVADRLPSDPRSLRTLVRLTGVELIVVRARAVGPASVEQWLKLPGIKWIHRDELGDLLGVVTFDQPADLEPLLLACAGYPTNGVGRDRACDDLVKQLASPGRSGGFARPRADSRQLSR